MSTKGKVPQSLMPSMNFEVISRGIVASLTYPCAIRRHNDTKAIVALSKLQIAAQRQSFNALSFLFAFLFLFVLGSVVGF